MDNNLSHYIKELKGKEGLSEEHITLAYAAAIRPDFDDKWAAIVRRTALRIKAAQEGFVPTVETDEHESLPSLYSLSGMLVQYVGSEVEQIRQQLFNQSEAPFKSVEEATRWIKEMAESEPDYVVARLVIDRETLKRIHENHLPPANPVTPENPIMVKAVGYRGVENELLKFSGADGKPSAMRTSGQGNNYWATPLGRLKSAAEKLAKNTGWQEAQGVIHILTGRIPLLPSARIRAHLKNLKTSAGWVSHRYASATIFDSNPSAKVIKQIHADMRKLLDVKYKKRVDDDQRELIKFVEEHSAGVKCDTAEEFWKILAQLWTESGRGKPLKGASFQKRYQRNCRKFGVETIRFPSLRRSHGKG